jgi:hypothetical protein
LLIIGGDEFPMFLEDFDQGDFDFVLYLECLAVILGDVQQRPYPADDLS